MKKSFLFILGLTALLAGCTQENDGNEIARLIELSQEEQKIVEQSNKFAFGLLNAACKNLDDKQQVLVSPFSASLALSMAMNGATGETLNEMMKVVGFEGTTLDEVNAFNEKLMKELIMVDKTTKISFANSLWLDNVTPQETYKATLDNHYNAEIFTRDFTTAGTLDAINGWCSKATNGNIRRMYDKLPNDLKFLLINTTYFKAEWAKPFTKITDGKFTKENGEVQTVTFMQGEHEAYYYKTDKFTLDVIYYRTGGFNFSIIMPNDGVSIDECMEELAGGALYHENLMNNAELGGYVDLDLTMPMYDAEFKTDIIPALMSMGIKKAFHETAAEFPNMIVEGDMYINHAMQATRFKVDELGAEASTATSVGGGDLLATAPPKKRKLVVDRPFIFCVKEQSTETILFAGKMGEI